MKVVLNPDYAAHAGQVEIYQGRQVPCFERASRIDSIIESIRAEGWNDFVPPEDHGEEAIRRVHRDDYVDFLQGIWSDWLAAGQQADILPYVWPTAALTRVNHRNLNARIGSYAFSSDTPIMAGTWQAAYSGAQSALTGLKHLLAMGQGGVFALTRPPGHHAHAASYGGYCFLNNAAIAASAALGQGVARVCILDIDYHHGNGTQDIFYQSPDVLTVSLHADPQHNFPYYLGYADEAGSAAGEGYNLNLPLANGTGFTQWRAAFLLACEKIARFDPVLLIVALGVDTYEGDPISSFRFKSDDFLSCGALISGLNRPALFVMEGGYDVGPIGQNVFNVLAGFEAG